MHTFKVHNGTNLVDVAVHAALAYHVRSDALGLGGRRLQQRAELLERDVVVELARRQQVMLEHRAV